MAGTIMIVEDEPAVARGVEVALQNEGYSTAIVPTGEEAVARFADIAPDLILLDVRLPGIDGFEVCRRLRRETRAPVLFLTARADEVDKVVGLEIGADDYLVKPFAMEELVARVDALLRRGRAITDTQRLQVGDLTLDLLRREAQRDGRIIELTAKEFALLEYLMRHPGQVLTRTQIIDHVWRYDSDALSNVVDIYIHYLRDKIDRGSSHPMIKTMRGVGYRIEP
jgi:DNA-binding response OmpR family regulator